MAGPSASIVVGCRSWSAQNGMLVNTVPDGGHGTDLVGTEKFWNFTVRFEYLVPKGANSGFYLRGRHGLRLKLSRLRPDLSQIKRIANIGLPAGAEQMRKARSKFESLYAQIQIDGQRPTRRQRHHGRHETQPHLEGHDKPSVQGLDVEKGHEMGQHIGRHKGRNGGNGHCAPLALHILGPQSALRHPYLSEYER